MQRQKGIHVCALVVAGAMLTMMAGQVVHSAESAVTSEGGQDVGGYRPPALRESPKVRYPTGAATQGGEGWVTLNLMVDATGKPYEVAVVESLGGEPFEREALDVIQRSVFDPARDGDTAVNASVLMTVRFQIEDGMKGARPLFVRRLGKVSEAIWKKDRSTAGKLLAELQPRNFYEETFRNVVRYEFHKVWGTTVEQRDALRDVVRDDNARAFLGRENYAYVLDALLAIEAGRGDLGAALGVWASLSPAASDAQRSHWEPRIAEILARRADGMPLRQSMEVTARGAVFHTLFRREFEIVIAAGRLDEVKLRCEKDYIAYPFDTSRRYVAAPSLGECVAEILGEPGTRFDLVEH